MDYLIDAGFAMLFRKLKKKGGYDEWTGAIEKLIRVYQLAKPEAEIWQEVCDRKEQP